VTARTERSRRRLGIERGEERLVVAAAIALFRRLFGLSPPAARSARSAAASLRRRSRAFGIRSRCAWRRSCSGPARSRRCRCAAGATGATRRRRRLALLDALAGQALPHPRRLVGARRRPRPDALLRVPLRRRPGDARRERRATI